MTRQRKADNDVNRTSKVRTSKLRSSKIRASSGPSTPKEMKLEQDHHHAEGEEGAVDIKKKKKEEDSSPTKGKMTTGEDNKAAATTSEETRTASAAKGHHVKLIDVEKKAEKIISDVTGLDKREAKIFLKFLMYLGFLTVPLVRCFLSHFQLLYLLFLHQCSNISNIDYAICFTEQYNCVGGAYIRSAVTS